MTTHRIIFGQSGQTLAHTPAGYVASASYVIENLRFGPTDASRTIASGSATVASWSLTSSATSGPTTTTPRKFSTASTTGATIGDPAQLVAADGDAELVVVGAISSGSYVETVSPIAGTYPSGSTLRGIKLSTTFPNAYAADEDELEREPPLRVTWVYTLGGVLWRVPELIEWSRHSVGDLDLAEAILVVRELYPDITRLPDGANLERAAARLAEEVRDDIRARRLDPAAIMLGPGGRGLLAARIVAWASVQGYSPGPSEHPSFMRWAIGDYQAKLANLTVGLGSRGTLGVDVTDNPNPNSIQPLTFAL